MRPATLIFLAVLLLTSAIDLAHADRLPPLIDALKSADTATKLNAIKGLGESGDIRAVPPLVEALHDEREVVRQYAAEALQNLVSVLDDVYGVVKRWLQSLLNKLRLHPADEVITVEQPIAHRRVMLLGVARLAGGCLLT
jgi:HEAT repeat protein